MNTVATKKLVEDNQIVTLKADKTHRNKTKEIDEINHLMVELGNHAKTIPFLAIYPAGVDKPIILDGLITQGQLLDAIQRAGPSKE